MSIFNDYLSYFHEAVIYSRYDCAEFNNKRSISISRDEFRNGYIENWPERKAEFGRRGRKKDDTPDLFQEGIPDEGSNLENVYLVSLKRLTIPKQYLVDRKDLYIEKPDVYFTFVKIKDDGRIINPPHGKTSLPCWVPYFFFQYRDGSMNLSRGPWADAVRDMDRIMASWEATKKADDGTRWKTYYDLLVKSFETITENSFYDNSVECKGFGEVQRVLDYDERVFITDDIDISMFFTNTIMSLYDEIKGKDKIDSTWPIMNLLNPDTSEPYHAKQSDVAENLYNRQSFLGHIGDHGLNTSQMAALFTVKSAAEGDVIAIQGPPGTGKTTLIESIVADAIVSSIPSKSRLRASRPEFILLSSTNNRAVANALERIQKDMATDSDDPMMCRWIDGVSSVAAYYSGTENARKYQHLYRKVIPRGDHYITVWQGWVERIARAICSDDPKTVPYGTEPVTASDRAQEYCDAFIGKAAKALSVDKSSKAVIDELYRRLDAEKKLIATLAEKGESKELNSARKRAFWLAVHINEYRFTEYILKYTKLMKTDTTSLYESVFCNNDAVIMQRAYDLIACITPCICSTFYSLPGFFNVWQKGWRETLLKQAQYLIVDEAGQVLPEIAVPSFALAKKAVVIGDTKQIEPVWEIPVEIDEMLYKAKNLPEGRTTTGLSEEMNCSSSNLMAIAEKACPVEIYVHGSKKGNRGIMLTEHWRCYDSIIMFCKEEVYHDLAPKRGDSSSKWLLPMVSMRQLEDGASIQGLELGSRANRAEAELINNWMRQNLKTIVDNALSEASRKGEKLSDDEIYDSVIGIITPFRGQRKLLKELLEDKTQPTKMITSDEDFATFVSRHVTIGTVHSFQGGEKDIIIFSSVYGNDDKDSLSFVDDKVNLINVAVSRARNAFVLITSLDENLLMSGSFIGRLINHIKGMEDNAFPDVVYSSDAEAETYVPDAMVAEEAHSYMVEENVSEYDDARESSSPLSDGEEWITEHGVRHAVSFRYVRK